MFKRKNSLLLLVLVFALCLCGCTKNIELSAGKFPEDSINIAFPIQPEDLPLMSGFTQLQNADFSGSTCYEEIIAWAQANPGVNVSYTVALPGGKTVANDSKSLDLSGMDAAALSESLSLLGYLPFVEQITLPDGVDISQLQSFATACPNAELNFKTSVAGMEISHDTGSLDLSRSTSADVEALLPWMNWMKAVEKINLGTEDGRLTWDDISALSAACPEAELTYSFKLYGKDFTLADTQMDLNHIPIDDNGALVKQVTSLMPNLELLDMDTCGVPDEAMAEIRDNLPNTKVVWRIWFGERYSVRTDVTKILASNPGMGGELTGENTASLKYCTEVVYLDVGHNSWLDDVSFVGCMPNLEVAVLAMGNWSDISELAKCPKLEYVELQTSCLNDLRPLSELKNLRHLNIAYCVALTDLSPIYDLELERLWIGSITPIPKEQVQEFKTRHPNCEVNTTTLDPTDGTWRFTRSDFGLLPVPRYYLLRQQFEYERGNDSYAYYYNDPLY